MAELEQVLGGGSAGGGAASGVLMRVLGGSDGLKEQAKHLPNSRNDHPNKPSMLSLPRTTNPISDHRWEREARFPLVHGGNPCLLRTGGSEGQGRAPGSWEEGASSLPGHCRSQQSQVPSYRGKRLETFPRVFIAIWNGA